MPEDGFPTKAAPVHAAPIHMAPASSARRALVLAACLMATFMAAVESSIVATAMPTIVADLGGFHLFSWVFAIYLLTQAVSIPVYGRLADIYGRKKVFYVGAGLFLIGSTLCGFAGNMATLILFRALQGFGAGGVQPIATTILGDIYTPTERAHVQGLVSSVFGVSAVLGPSLGAFLVEQVSWQFVFWVNLPIGVAAIAMIATFLNESVQHRRHRIDYLGSLLLMLTVAALMVVLVQGASLPRTALLTVGVTGVAMLVALALHELRTPEPMLPLELWRQHRIILVGSLGGATISALMMGISAFLPTYVQGAMGRSALAGGLVLGVMSVTWALASFFGGRLMVRTTYRLTAVLGTLALIIGSAVLITLTPERGVPWAVCGSLLIGVGMGLCNTTFIVSVQAAVPWQQRGAATSSVMFLRFVGQSLGAASFGAVLNLTLLHQAPEMAHMVDQLLDPVQRSGLAPGDLARLTEVVAAGLHNTYVLGGALAVVALGLALTLPAKLSPRSRG
ncbi:MAG: MDR family MFS transporter [Acetobacteraceae bacterium]